MRLILEGVGLAVAAAAHVVIILMYGLGATLAPFNDYPIAYWFFIGAGYLGLALLLATAKVTIGHQISPRQLLDISLLTFFGTLLVVGGFVVLNWPLSLRGWDGHGMGSGGGEGNMILLPWLHMVSILMAGRILLPTHTIFQ